MACILCWSSQAKAEKKTSKPEATKLLMYGTFCQPLHFKSAAGLAGNTFQHESTLHMHPPSCIPGRRASSHGDNVCRQNLFHFHHNHPIHSSIHQRTTLYSLRCENELSLGAHVSWIPGCHKAGGSGLPASLFASRAASSDRTGFREGVKWDFFS